MNQGLGYEILYPTAAISSKIKIGNLEVNYRNIRYLSEYL